jgi:hypothetical protein
MKSGAWTEDDLKTLRLYAEQGRSVYRIAAALNRTVAGVRSTAQRHSISIGSGQRASRAFRAANAAEGRPSH